MKGGRQPDSPPLTTPPRPDQGAAREHGLARPQGPWRPAAPPAQGGHARSSDPTSSSCSSRRLHRASARDSLSGSPQRRGSSAGQSAAEFPTPGPLATPLSPANQAAVALPTAWREGWRLTSTELTLGAPERGLVKGGGVGGRVCVTPTQRKGVTRRRANY